MYWPASDMVRGLSVSVEVKGGLMVATGDIMTRSGEVISNPPNCHSTSTVTSLSTASGIVTVHVRVCLVPSYREPLGTARTTDGVGTVRKGVREGGREGRKEKEKSEKERKRVCNRR